MNVPKRNSIQPMVKELSPLPNIEAAFEQFSKLPYCIFFDSALSHPTLGRYSFLAADPFDFLRLSTQSTDSFVQLKRRMELYSMQLYSVDTIAELPPFQGGAAGLFSYDLNVQLESLPLPRHDEFQVPALAVGIYDIVLAWDHQQERAWLISTGLPAENVTEQQKRATERLQFFESVLANEISLPKKELSAQVQLAQHQLAQQFPIESLSNLSSNFSRENYLTAVQRAIEYIHAGDIFQVNLSQRLLYPATSTSTDLYLRLRKRNAATFAAYFDLDDFQIISASPERFLQVQNGLVETRPIKGTRQRLQRPEADLFKGDELKASEKDRAENMMIVDLLRNDLSKVCMPDSIQVTQLCEVENYQYVQHLVSAVQGKLKPEHSALDLLQATFPGGSITGAPKPRAMEIIQELEPTARGPYCGSLGYWGFDGSLDTSILIRTITAGKGWWQAPVGGGIIAASQPETEYQETWDKAEGLLRAFKE